MIFMQRVALLLGLSLIPFGHAAAGDDDPLPEGAVARLGTLRLRHPGPAPAVALSPDARRVASGGNDKHIRLWDAATGKELRHWDSGQGAITRLRYSPDGRLLATAGSDHTIRLWDADAGKERLRLETDAKPISYLAFSADGRNLITAEGDGLARQWEVATGKERRRWQVFHGKEIRPIGGHPEFQFVALASPPDGSRLAWATYRVERIDRNLVGYHGAVAVWDADSGKERCRLHGPELRPKPIAFSPDGKTLALVLDAGPVSLWDATTGKLLRQFDEVALPPTDLVFSPDGKVLAVVNAGSAALLDAATGKLLHRVGPGPDNSQYPDGTGVSFSTDGKTLALTALARTTLWNVETGKPELKLHGHQTPVTSVQFARDGKSLASLASRETRIWDAATWAETSVLPWGVVKRPWGVAEPLAAFSADGRRLTYESDRETVRFRESPSGKLLPRFRPGDFAFWLAPFAPDGRTVAVVRSDRALCLYDAEAGQGLRRIDEKTAGVVSPVVFSPNGKLLAWVNSGGTVSVVYTATGERVHLLGKGVPTDNMGALIAKGVGTVAFTPDGKALAAGGEYDNVIRLWDVQTGKPFREFVGHTGPVGVIAFSADGQWLASTGVWERAIRLWDVATGKERCQFAGHQEWVRSLAFAPDGKRLATSSADGTVLVWETPAAVGAPSK